MRRRWLLVGGGLITLMLLAPHVGLPQQVSEDLTRLRFEVLHKDIEALKAGQKAILDELQEMKKLLSSRGQARGDERSPVRDINTVLRVGDDFSKGDKQATLTLVEFTDYQ